MRQFIPRDAVASHTRQPLVQQSGAFATSPVNTGWKDDATRMRAELVGLLDRGRDLAAELDRQGLDAGQTPVRMGQMMVQPQSVTLATNHVFLLAGCAFSLGALAVWLAPRPARGAETSHAHWHLHQHAAQPCEHKLG